MKEQPRKIWYSEIMELGFKVEECRDDVFEKEYGYPYRIISKKLTKDILINYHQDERQCHVLREDKDGNVLGRMVLRDIESVRSIIEFYKKKK